MEYNECKVIAKLNKKSEPLISIVPCDEYTQMVQNNFDYTFTGESKFYPYELPTILNDMDFDIMVITGASGSGKSTLLKEFDTGGGIRIPINNTILLKLLCLTSIHQKKQVLS